MAIVRERIKKAWQEFVKFDEKLQEFVSKETETDSASIKRNKKYQRAFGIGFIISFSLFWVVFFSVARTEDGTGRNLPSVFFELVTSPRGGETLLTGRHFSLLVPFLSDLW